MSVDDIIERRRLKSHAAKRKHHLSDNESEASLSDDGSDREGMESDDEQLTAVADDQDEEDPLATSDEEGGTDEGRTDESEEEDSDEGEEAQFSSEDESEVETQVQKDRKAAFFASDVIQSEEHSSFLSMNLSRPIIKSVTALGFHKPTPIQAATIPVALLGKDVVGNAVTGSGKTAAFIIPMLERLMYRDRGQKAAATRCLVLVPTRELGVQCFEVGTKLAAHTDIRFSLVVGTRPSHLIPFY